MRVLQIAKYMYPFLGGTEQVTRDLVGAFNANGAENKVICFNEDSTDGEITTHRNETVTDKVDGKLPSDHYPVTAQIEFTR